MEEIKGITPLVRATIVQAQGFYDLGMHHEAWDSLEDLPPENLARPEVMSIRLDVLLALERLDDAVAVGIGACHRWPEAQGFIVKTANTLMKLKDDEKAKMLLLAAPASITAHAAYWYELSRSQARTGDMDGARKSLWECFNRDKALRALALEDADFHEVWKSV